MAATFGLRGDSFTPRLNGTGGPSYGLAGNTLPTVSANAGAIDGTVLDLANAGTATLQNVAYNGVGNWPSTRTVSVNISVSFPSLTGTALSLYSCGAPDNYSSFEVYINSTNIIVRMANELGQVGINSVAVAHGGLSNDTFYDITVTYTGDNSANGCEVFLDETSLGTITSTRSWDNPRDEVYRYMGLGFGDVANLAYMEVQEFTIWDSVIVPSAVALETGTGLDGASRVDYVDIPVSDGAASSSGPIRKTL